ncbi:MAG: hypothetical protein ACXACI_00015 [Candidatus Hodarchaeales archaeon]|jgi:hypothetical protein
MSEWLGKPRIKKEDMTKIFQEFPHATEWFVNERKTRLVTILDPDEGQRFFAALKKKYQKVNPFIIEEVARKAILAWIEANE